jgi:hypothetical protein
MPAAGGDATSILIDARELALILEGIALPTPRKRAKAQQKKVAQRPCVRSSR